MGIEKLKTILTVPDAPNNSGIDKSWEEIERRLGAALPDDYKAFINQYGTGSINRFFYVLNPFAENENMEFFTQAENSAKAYNSLKDKFPEYFRYETFPNDGGLLLWGLTDNGDELCWKTSKEKWTIVTFPSREGDDESFSYDMSMTEFIYNILSGNIAEGEHIFPEDLLENGVSYEN